jgi:CheY-like chemotaxis protein
MPHGTTEPKLRILLAEEQAAARDLVVLVLSRLHYQIERAATGRDALARARHQGADLVLLSATLPDMAGPDLIGALRHLPGLDQTPIVAICPGGSSEIRQACHAAGAAAHLTRPLEIERLLRLIEQLIRRRDQTAACDSVLDLDHLRGFTDGDPQLEGELSACFCPPPRCIGAACTRRWPTADHGARSRMLSRGPAPISARAGCRRWPSPPNARSPLAPISKRSSAPLMRSARSSIVTQPADGVRQQQRRSLTNSLIRTSVSPEIIAGWLWRRWPQTNRV